MKRPMLGAAALATAGALTTLTFAPAFATHTVSQADATALRLSIAGTPADSGTVTATNSGTTSADEVKTGETQPLLGVLGNQDLIDTGVLLQDANALIQGQDGVSTACAGVAGQGGAIVEVGDAGCITPGDALGLNIANLDLTGAVLVNPESALGALSALQPVLADVLAPVTAALVEGLAPLADLGIGGTLGAVDAFCRAVPGSATGGAHLVDTQLALTLPGMDPIVLANLPANPAPNQKVVTDLNGLAAMLASAIKTNFATILDEALADVTNPLLTTLLEELIVETILAELDSALDPVLTELEAGLLDITLNKQSSNGPGHIEVTALDVQLVGAARDFLDSALVELEIGNVNCGPNSRIHPPVTPENPEEPEVPTVVNSGLEGGAADEEAGKAIVAGGLLALAGAAGALGYRRFAAK